MPSGIQGKRHCSFANNARMPLSKHYIKSNHYISEWRFREFIRESGYLFTSCRLHAKQNSFKVRASESPQPAMPFLIGVFLRGTLLALVRRWNPA
jgi:hypothetical protein